MISDEYDYYKVNLVLGLCLLIQGKNQGKRDRRFGKNSNIFPFFCYSEHPLSDLNCNLERGKEVWTSGKVEKYGKQVYNLKMHFALSLPNLIQTIKFIFPFHSFEISTAAPLNCFVI